MTKVRVSHHADPRFFEAPLVTGELRIDDDVWTTEFLVDTGAHTTSVNGGTLPGIEDSYMGAPQGRVDGVGGGWPCRLFKDTSIVLRTLDEDAVELQLPAVKVMCPYIKVLSADRREEAPAGPPPQLPGSRRKLHDQYTPCQVPNLLGRDLFNANRLSLTWDPFGESFIRVPVDGPA